MKTTIGVLKFKTIPSIEAIACEFFGVLARGKNNRKDGILWLTFSSKENAREFSKVISAMCIDTEKKAFK